MNIFSKRPVAILTAAVVIAGSTLFGVHRSLSPLVQSTANSFYDGVYSEAEGYTTKSIYSQLDALTDASLGLITKCSDAFPEECSSMRSARSELLETMDSRDVSDMYDAFKSLCESYNGLRDAISGSSLENDSAVADYTSTFTGAQAVIAASGYNAAVRSLESDTLGVFPANIFSELLDIEAPELFD